VNIFLVCLVVSAIALAIQANTQEELLKISLAIVLLLCLFLALVFAPWLIKSLLVVLLLLSDKYISLFLVSKEL
jgi:hypothetical protein